MSKTKAKTDGNEQPAKGMNAELKPLMARIAEYGKLVVSVREAAHALLLDVGFFGMKHGNLKPFTALIHKSNGMNRKAMVAWGKEAFGIDTKKDKDSGDESIVAGPAFKDHVAAFKADKLAFAKRVRSMKKFWDYAPDRPFEGLDLIQLLNAAANKVERAGKDKDKASKVKGVDLVPKVRAFIESIAPKTDDDDGSDGGEGEDDIQATVHEGDAAEAQVSVH